MQYKRFSHFPTKINSVLVIFTFEIITNDVGNFEQPAPGLDSVPHKICDVGGLAVWSGSLDLQTWKNIRAFSAQHLINCLHGRAGCSALFVRIALKLFCNITEAQEPGELVKQYEPRHEKTCLRGFRPGPTQTGMYIQRLVK